MSLITEALKKARQEAARQEALKRGGSAYPWMSTSTQAQGRTRSTLVTVVVAVCLAAGLGAAGAVWWLSRDMGEQPAAEAAIEQTEQTAERGPSGPREIVVEELDAQPMDDETAPPAETELETAVPVQETTAEPVRPPLPVLEERTPEPAPRTPEPPAPVIVAPPREEPAPAPPSDPAPSAPTEPTPAEAETGLSEAARAAGLEDGKSFVRQLPVPGGGTLSLNGIAYSTENPVALFSDRVVGPGESISGFTVVGMNAQRVELKGHGVTVYVTLK